LQQHLLLKPYFFHPDAREGIQDLFGLLDAVGEGELLYLIVPSKGAWYVGRTAASRLRGKQPAPGAQVRGLEHLCAVLGKGADAGQAKYRKWKSIGVDAISLLPVCWRSSEEVRELESYVIVFVSWPCRVRSTLWLAS
jgi:hypothetical protein